MSIEKELKEREERFTIHDENKVSSEDIKKLIKKWVEGQTFLIGKYSEYLAFSLIFI